MVKSPFYHTILPKKTEYHPRCHQCVYIIPSDAGTVHLLLAHVRLWEGGRTACYGNVPQIPLPVKRMDLATLLLTHPPIRGEILKYESLIFQCYKPWKAVNKPPSYVFFKENKCVTFIMIRDSCRVFPHAYPLQATLLSIFMVTLHHSEKQHKLSTV